MAGQEVGMVSASLEAALHVPVLQKRLVTIRLT